MLTEIPTNCRNCGAPLVFRRKEMYCQHCGTTYLLSTEAEQALQQAPIEQQAETKSEGPEQPASPARTPTKTTPLQTFLRRKPDYQADFSSPHHGWPVEAGLDFTSRAADGKYHLLTARVPSGYFGAEKMFEPLVWIARPKEGDDPFLKSLLPRRKAGQPAVQDYALEAEIELLESDPDGYFGLVGRCLDQDNYYLFEVTADGNFRVEKKHAGAWQALAAWAESPHLITGDGAVNTLRVQCAGPELAFFANGQQLIQVKDGDLSAGAAGLFTGKYRYTAPHAGRLAVSAFKIWSLATSNAPDSEGKP
jgi:hypothetical protein